MSIEFWSVWVEDPEIEGRWLNAFGAGQDNAERYRDELIAKGRQAFVLPFGQKPECRECEGFTDEFGGICKGCQDELPAQLPMREVA